MLTDEPSRIYGSAPGRKPAGTRGDAGWLDAHAELRPLHIAKAGTYGTDAEPLANYVQTSAAIGQVAEYTPLVRIIEKLERVKNLVLSGRADEVKDWPDIAALALGAEALRRRRSPRRNASSRGRRTNVD